VQDGKRLDAVLMERLRERQQARVSSAGGDGLQARGTQAGLASPRPSALAACHARLPSFSASSSVAPSLAWPYPWVLAVNRERWFPLIAGGLVILLLLVAPAGSAEVCCWPWPLGVTVVNLQRRNGAYSGCGLELSRLLCVALLLGGGLLQALRFPPFRSGCPHPSRCQSLPAMALLPFWGALIDHLSSGCLMPESGQGQLRISSRAPPSFQTP